MAIAVVTKASGGMPVIDVTATKPGLGVPVTEATNGSGIVVTKVSLAIGGLPVTFVLAGNEWPSGGGTTYATWDAATVTAVTLSGGNLVATNTGTSSADQGAKIASAAGKTSGKYYFEVTLTTVAGGQNAGVGICTTSSTYTAVGNSATVGVVFYQGGSIYANGSSAGITFGTQLSGTVFEIAVDMDNRRIWFRPHGANWNNNGSNNPATNVGGIVVPSGTMVPVCVFGGLSGVINNKYTGNFGASAFGGAVPAGFTSGWPI